MAITAADPSGLWGRLKEAISSGWAMLGVKKDDPANPLAKAVAEDITDSTIRSAARDRMQAQFKGAHVEEIKLKAIEKLRTVASGVDAKAPAESQRLQGGATTRRQKATEAGSEGGFLGFGGVTAPLCPSVADIEPERNTVKARALARMTHVIN